MIYNQAVFILFYNVGTSGVSLTLKLRYVLQTINYNSIWSTAPKVALVRKHHVTYDVRSSTCFILWMNQLSGSQHHRHTRTSQLLHYNWHRLVSSSKRNNFNAQHCVWFVVALVCLYQFIFISLLWKHLGREVVLTWGNSILIAPDKVCNVWRYVMYVCMDKSVSRRHPFSLNEVFLNVESLWAKKETDLV